MLYDINGSLLNEMDDYYYSTSLVYNDTCYALALSDNKVLVVNIVIGDNIEITDINSNRDYGSNFYDKMEDEGIAANPIKLQSGEYFVLGDNRNSSEDSRSANIGIVKSGMIVGKAWFKLKSENAAAGPILNHY